MRTRWKSIARVVKTHARFGEVVVASVHGLPPLLRAGMEVALVPPSLATNRYLVVARAGRSDRASQLVAFEGVDSIGEARELVGKTLLVRMDDLPSTIDLLDKDELVGRSVTDSRLGYLGTVSSVLAGPSQDVYVLDGPRGELLVPILPEFVLSSDGDAIELALPNGVLAVRGE